MEQKTKSKGLVARILGEQPTTVQKNFVRWMLLTLLLWPIGFFVSIFFFWDASIQSSIDEICRWGATLTIWLYPIYLIPLIRLWFKFSKKLGRTWLFFFCPFVPVVVICLFLAFTSSLSEISEMPGMPENSEIPEIPEPAGKTDAAGAMDTPDCSADVFALQPARFSAAIRTSRSKYSPISRNRRSKNIMKRICMIGIHYIPFSMCLFQFLSPIHFHLPTHPCYDKLSTHRPYSGSVRR